MKKKNNNGVWWWLGPLSFVGFLTIFAISVYFACEIDRLQASVDFWAHETNEWALRNHDEHTDLSVRISRLEDLACTQDKEE